MECLCSMSPYIHGVLVFEGSLYSWSACVPWVLIFRGFLYLMGPYIHGVLVFDGSI